MTKMCFSKNFKWQKTIIADFTLLELFTVSWICVKKQKQTCDVKGCGLNYSTTIWPNGFIFPRMYFIYIISSYYAKFRVCSSSQLTAN